MKRKMSGFLRPSRERAGSASLSQVTIWQIPVRQGGSTRSPGKFRAFWVLSGSFLFIALLFFALPLLRLPFSLRGLEAEPRTNARGDPLIYQLCGPNNFCGPNDGEPINGLRLLTNYAEHGSISVYVNHVFFYTRPLDLNSRRDGSTGILTSNIDLDMDRAMRLSGGSPAITVTLYLYSDSTSRLVTYQEWQGNFVRPWIEFLPKKSGNQNQGSAPGTPGPAGPIGLTGMVVHPLPSDTYFLLLASTQKEKLSLSPDDPRIFHEARLVGSGSCVPYRTESVVKNIVYLDTSLESSVKQVFVVLWTYDVDRGWKQSSITTVPRP